ncbi:MAG TPA: YceI family protein [Gemmatimonadales bacterium]|nr:YceI family protein [Gemmatimonadales bacterium]
MRIAWLHRFLTGLALVPAIVRAQSKLPTKYEIDEAHSSVSFAVRFMGLTTIHGAFSQYAGTLMVTPDDLARSSVSVVIQVSSINTNNGQRDHDLQNAAFFDAAHFPLITFRSTSVVPSALGFTLNGQLTIRGITKDVAIPCTLLHPATRDAWRNTRIGFVGTLAISRREFGVLGTAFWNSEYDPGRMSIGDSVTIELAIEGLQPNYDKWNSPGSDSLAQVALGRGAAAVKPPVDSVPTVNGYVVAGLKLLGRGRADLALRLFEVASGLAPEAPQVYVHLGDARMALGQEGMARDAFRRALAADSLNTSAAESLRWLDRQ